MMNEQNKSQHAIKRGKKVWLAYLMLTFFAYCLNVVGPSVNYLSDELSFSYTEIGLHTSALALGMVVVGLFGKKLLKSLSDWQALAIGGIGMGLGSLLLVFGDRTALTLPGLFFMGAFGALILAVYPLILQAEMGAHSTVGVSEANTLSSIFSTLAPIAVGFFGGMVLTWRPAVYLVTGMSFLIGAWILLSPEFPKKIKVDNEELDEEKGRLPLIYWIFWAALVISVSIEFCLIYWSAEHLQAQVGIPKDNATKIVSLFLAGMVIGRFIGGRLLVRFSRYQILGVSILIGILGFAIFWFSQLRSLSVIGLFLAGLGVANLYASIVTLLYEVAGPLKAAAGSGSILASGVAILSLPFLLGLLADLIGIRLALLLVTLLYLLLIVTISVGKRRIQSE
ncbi:MAG: MFS transporter [Syntrophomonadaceae bacterium]|jgi:fucose permease